MKWEKKSKGYGLQLYVYTQRVMNYALLLNERYVYFYKTF